MKKMCLALATVLVAVSQLITPAQAAPVPTVSTAPSCTLTATPSTVQQNEQTTLSYTATNAFLAVVDQGVGIVSPAGTGTVQVWVGSPETTYTMTVAGPTGVGTCQVTVTVLPPPPATELLGCWNVKYQGVKITAGAKNKIKAPGDQTVCFYSGQVNYDGTHSYSGMIPGNYTASAYAYYVPSMGYVNVGVSLNDYSTQSFMYLESHVYFSNKGKADKADGQLDGYYERWGVPAPDAVFNGDSSFERAKGK